jgi:hypothetical protein
VDFLRIVQIVVAALTIAIGLVSLWRPRAVFGFTGLEAPGPRGITEIRSILGGAFIGLGVAPLILGAGAAYQMLGITYLVIAAARAIGMAVDRSVVSSNVISLVSEVVFGLVLLF